MKTQPIQQIAEDLATKSRIALIVGDIGSGKTATGLKIMEDIHNLHPERQLYALEQKNLPSWIKNIHTLQQTPENSTILIDEAQLKFNARESMSLQSRKLIDILSLIRHNNQSCVFITQESTSLDVNIIRKTHHLIVKEMTIAQIKFERGAIREDLEKAQTYLEGKDKEHAYILLSKYEGPTKVTLPSFWDANKTSKTHRRQNPLKNTEDTTQGVAQQTQTPSKLPTPIDAFKSWHNPKSKHPTLNTLWSTFSALTWTGPYLLLKGIEYQNNRTKKTR